MKFCLELYRFLKMFSHILMWFVGTHGMESFGKQGDVALAHQRAITASLDVFKNICLN